MNALDPRLPMIAAEAKVKTCHVFHCWNAMRELGKNFHKGAFALFAGLEERHVEAILSALQAHDALPAVKGRGISGKSMIAADWTPPPVSELPPQARSCAQQWTPASYATHGEAFRSYWRGTRKMMADWQATWANRIVQLHSNVMRDQKFGNAPTLSPFEIAAKADPRTILERQLADAELLGRDYEASIARNKLAALDNVIPFTRTEGESYPQKVAK